MRKKVEHCCLPSLPFPKAQLHSWLFSLLPPWVVQGQWEVGIQCQSTTASLCCFSLFTLSPAPVWVPSSMGCSPSGQQCWCGSCRLQFLQSTPACCRVGTCSTMVLQGQQRISPFPKCVFPKVPAVLLKRWAVPCSPGLPSQTHCAEPTEPQTARLHVRVLSFGREKKSFWICLKMNTGVWQ